ncbi:helix-turn-helix transcriptional regulator [Candidatus Woesearchaeota archaeon]|nr:helix-turn-helix transcriptional regulator [Candidatus Woesearchaeota archaeon]
MGIKCPIRQTVEFMGKKWTLLILLELHRGDTKSKRYSSIKSQLTGITPKILSARLKEMEKQKLIKKRVDASKFPVKTYYSMTEKGEGFLKILNAVKHWSLKYNKPVEFCEHTDCTFCDVKL